MQQTIIILISAIFAGFIIGWIASKKDWQTLKMCLVVALIGLPFGWVVGLSVSPVLQTVITSLVAVVASGVAILSRISSADKAESAGSNKNSASAEKKPSSLKEVDPLPIAILMVAFAIGSTSGVYYRANDMFGTDPKVIVERWENVGLDGKEVAQAVFKAMYPSVNSKNDKSGDNTVGGKERLGVLFSGELKVNEELERIKRLPDKELASHLATLPDDRIRNRSYALPENSYYTGFFSVNMSSMRIT